MKAKWAWSNQDCSLWDMTEQATLVSHQPGNIAVWRMFGKPALNRLVIYGFLPQAGPYLDSLNQGHNFSIMNSPCGPVEQDLENGELVAKITGASVHRKWLAHPVPASPDEASTINLFVDLKCDFIELYFGEEET